MKLHHIAIWTFRLEELKEFYVRFFGGKSNEKYINPKKGFESYFISFGEGTDLELMSRTDVQNTPIEENRVGLTHFAFTFPSQEEVLRFTEQMRSEGYTIAGEPRTSGDGYFESVVLDPDGNRQHRQEENRDHRRNRDGSETRDEQRAGEQVPRHIQHRNAYDHRQGKHEPHRIPQELVSNTYDLKIIDARVR